ncbi:hypothetical protein LTR28_001310, partial [Elasticomyces elasticus]
VLKALEKLKSRSNSRKRQSAGSLRHPTVFATFVAKTGDKMLKLNGTKLQRSWRTGIMCQAWRK